MKIVVVGGIAAGMSAAARCKRIDENAEVIVFEKGDIVAFSNCGLPFHISEQIKTREDLILLSKGALTKGYGIDVRVGHEVININRDEKTIRVRNEDGEFNESYDKLILAPGARPNKLEIKGLDSIANSNLVTVDDASKIHDTMKENNLKNALVIGGGYIGIEAAENLKLAGYNVSVVVRSGQILKNYDKDMVQILHKELYDKGVDLRLDTKVESIKDNQAILSNGDKIACDYVVIAAGVSPRSELAKEAGLELTEKGYIKIDSNQLTNDPDIYAIGDATEVYNMISKEYMPLALAGPAQKASRIAADHIFGKTNLHPGYLGSSAIKIFDMNAAKTGLSCDELDALGKTNYDYVIVMPKEKVGLMPEAEDQFFKLIFERPTGKILGAQCISKGEAVKRVDQVGAMLPFGPTLVDAINMEVAYAPPFAMARDALNFAGMVGMNILTKDFSQVYMTEVRELVENGGYFLDVRSEGAFEKGHIRGAVNIPFGQLRDRIDEIPRDKPVYIYCNTSKSSYFGLKVLQGYGYENIISVQGSFLGLSYHEYYKDQTENRESILTGYAF